MKPNLLTREIIGAAIEVHRELGPGKPELAYESALAHELNLRGIVHQTQKPVPVIYKGVKLDCGYRVDLLVSGSVVIEVKSADAIHPVHRAQVLTYLKVGGWKLALLLNFNSAVLKEGIERFVLGLDEEGQASEVPQTIQTSGKAEFSLPVTNVGDEQSEKYAREVIASALEVHRCLGPGLLPSTYIVCLCHELHLRGIPFECKQPLALSYKGISLEQSDEMALLVGGRVVVNPYAITELRRVHHAAMLSQLRLGSWKLGLLINFNSLTIAEGLQRVALSQQISPTYRTVIKTAETR